MDFGEILDSWEKRRTPGGDMEQLLSRYPPRGAARPVTEESVESKGERAERARRLRALAPQAELDLHGLTAAEARSAVDRFLETARRKGFRKVLIVHGKGNHSTGKPVLAAAVRQRLEGSPLAGAFGPAERRQGGRGATWVLLRGPEGP